MVAEEGTVTPWEDEGAKSRGPACSLLRYGAGLYLHTLKDDLWMWALNTCMAEGKTKWLLEPLPVRVLQRNRINRTYTRIHLFINYNKLAHVIMEAEQLQYFRIARHPGESNGAPFGRSESWWAWESKELMFLFESRGRKSPTSSSRQSSRSSP